jgi:hypothetical protein
VVPSCTLLGKAHIWHEYRSQGYMFKRCRNVECWVPICGLQGHYVALGCSLDKVCFSLILVQGIFRHGRQERAPNVRVPGATAAGAGTHTNTESDVGVSEGD